MRRNFFDEGKFQDVRRTEDVNDRGEVVSTTVLYLDAIDLAAEEANARDTDTIEAIKTQVKSALNEKYGEGLMVAKNNSIDLNSQVLTGDESNLLCYLSDEDRVSLGEVVDRLARVMGEIENAPAEMKAICEHSIRECRRYIRLLPDTLERLLGRDIINSVSSSTPSMG